MVGGALTSATGCSQEADAAGEAAEVAAAPLTPTHYDPRQSLAPLIESVRPSVVSVKAHRGGQRLGGLRGAPASEGLGSGFIIDAEGLVVTNHHVIEDARTVEVRLSDGRQFEAEVVGSDPATDLALLRLSGARDLPEVTLGESKELAVGDWVVAMGNPMGLDYSATVGIISGKGRGSLGLYEDSYIDFLQTDADIAPGSSGGPLFDLQGEVVGINTAVGAKLRPGFAIPIDQARRIVEQLRDHGKVQRGWLGAASVVGDEGPGAKIGTVYARTPAERAGLRTGDVIEQVDGEPVENFEALRARVGTKRPGDEVELTVRRGDEILTLRSTLEARPDRQSLDALRPSSGAAPRPERSDRSSRWLPFGWDRSDEGRAGDHSESGSSGGRSEKGSGWSGGPRLGIGARATDDGLEVVEVHEGSLAETMGLRPGDVLRELNGLVLRRPSDVAEALASAGSSMKLRFERDGATHVVTFER